MANQKLYTAKQAAEAVLKKTLELLHKSEIVKAEQMPWKKPEADASQPAKGKAPKGEIQPKEKEQGSSDDVRSQKAPDNNPDEQAEGNNELAGTTPTQVGQDGKNISGFSEMRSDLKLAKFIGHMHSKRKMKAPLAKAEAGHEKSYFAKDGKATPKPKLGKGE